MFSREVLDHFQNPRNAGELNEATATVEVSNPVCGDVLRLSARIESGGIAEARFLCRGCTTSIACASRLTELLSGKQIGDLHEITLEALLGSFKFRMQPSSVVETSLTFPLCAHTTARAPWSIGAFESS